MKKGGLWLTLFVLLLAGAVAGSFGHLKDNINLGLDLQGGAEVVLQAVPEEGQTVAPEDMEALKEIMRNRVDNIGVSEPIIQLEGDDRIIIQLAGVDNPDDAIDILGRTAKLEFVDPRGNVVLTGADLVDAKGVRNTGAMDPSQENAISLKFNEEGTKKFAEATSKYLHQYISIYIDGELIMSPTVNSVISNGEAQITGGYTLEEAVSEAAILKGGALPVDVEVMSKRTVGPSLGADSLEKSLNAGIIGMALLLTFLIVYYRLPGVVAGISIVVYTLMLLWLMCWLNITLTLPGIAGFLLSIGMAVDANIIIYERLREEIANEKSLAASVAAGFKRALLTIMDSNITTLLATFVLFQFGTGSVQGFAVTLAVGIIVSMFTALVITQWLLKWCVDVPAFAKHPALFSNKKGGVNRG
ncbi:MAG: protein translocase subunit SecD [Firmicutes bacterium]|nr:protein translocase subunit SecD [Bacillota bacterium]